MPKYKFSNIAINITDKRMPTPEDKDLYIAPNNLDTDTLSVPEYGYKVDLNGTKLIMHKGDMLFGRREPQLKKAAIAPHDGLFSAHGMIFHPKEDVITKEFFPFFISSDYFFDAAIRISVGSLSPTVNWKDLKDLEFEIPDKDKQAEYAEILWAMIRSKKAYKDLIVKTDEFVKSQFIEMFGDMAENPHGWPIKRFDEVAEIDGTMTTDYERYAEYPHIGIDSIEKDTGRLFGYRTVREDNVKSGKYIFGPQHIIYSKIRPALNKVALPDFEGLCSADAYPILPREAVCVKEFLAHVLRSEYFLQYILAFSGRSQMPKVNRKQIAGFQFPLPPISMQKAFVAFMQQSDKSKFAGANRNLSRCLVTQWIIPKDYQLRH